MTDIEVNSEGNVSSTTNNKWKRAKDLMLMLALNETIEQLFMANTVCLYGRMLRRREYDHVLRRALELKLSIQERNAGQRAHGQCKLGEIV